MASQSNVEHIPLSTIHEDVEKDDAPLLATTDDAFAGALHRTQHRLHRFLRILFIVSIVLSVASCFTVIAREFLEFFGYDDKDRGLLTFPDTVYTRRDWPIMLMMLLSIVFAAVNLHRMRRYQKPLNSMINVGVLSSLLLMVCFAGFSMVPFTLGQVSNSCDKSRWPDPDNKFRQYFETVCGNLKLYLFVRRVDMLYVNFHAFVNFLLLILSIVHHWCEKRSAGEPLLPIGLIPEPYATKASRTLAVVTERCVQVGLELTQRGVRIARGWK